MKWIALLPLLSLASVAAAQPGQTAASQPTRVQAAPAPAADARYSLASVYHAFMERFAEENPAWKAEITLHANVNMPPKPPFRLGYNDTLGYYSYRVKQWDELNDYEKFAVQNDPRLPHFIRELCGRDIANAAPASIGTAAAAPAATATANPIAAAPAELAVPDLLPGQRIDLAKRPKGLLLESQGVFVYRFDPGDLLSTKAIRLVQTAKDQ